MKPHIFTSDWQLDVAHIAKTRKVVQDLITIAQNTGANTLWHLGDVKDQLNPLDGRVVNEMIAAVQLLKGYYPNLFVLLGNHDYYATTQGADSWAAALWAAGATVIDTPGVVVQDGVGYVCMPYQWPSECADYRQQVGRLVTKFGSMVSAVEKRVLLFHQGVEGGSLNALRKAQSGETAEITLADMALENFQYAIGGHYHGQHKVTGGAAPVWYVGSPFCTRWDEANQSKGYLGLVPRNRQLEIRQFPSSLPGWYDPQWPGMPDKVPAGARVRIKVQVQATDDVAGRVKAAQAEAAAAYPNAALHVVPVVTERDTAIAHVRSEVTDQEVVSQYVSLNLADLPEDARDEVSQLCLDALQQVGQSRRADISTRFESLEARNFLSFETLNIDFSRPGLYLVSGENRDRDGRSNGSGKTSYLHALYAAMFGSTLKGQKHDGLKRRGTPRNAESYVKLTCRLADGRTLEVHRYRQPKQVKLYLAGEDISSGRGDTEINRLVANLTGFTPEVLCNALYIDQRESNQLLAGRDAERREVFNSFLNLDRFAQAQGLVKAKVKDWQFRVLQRKEKAAAAGQTLGALAGNYQQMAETVRTQVQVIEERIKQREAELSTVRAAIEALPSIDPNLREAARSTAATAVAAYEAWVRLDARRRAINATPSRCSTCGAALSPAKIAELQAEHDDLVERVTAAKVAHEAAEKQAEAARTQLDSVAGITAERRVLESQREALIRNIGADRAQLTTLTGSTLARMRAKLEWVLLRKVAADYAIPEAEYTLARSQEAEAALHRNGIPAMLASLLCPQLNAAAQHYSRMISDGAVQVSFAIEGDSLMVEVENLTGGERVVDQSNGELRLAGLITTLALRSAVHSNVLFLDEMELGLDSVGAKELAYGIQALRSEFDTIYLASHNQALVGGLTNYEEVKITKENGVSRVA